MKKYVLAFAAILASSVSILAGSVELPAFKRGQSSIEVISTPTVSASRIGRLAEGDAVVPTIVNIWLTGPTKTNALYEQFVSDSVNALRVGNLPASVNTSFFLLAEHMTTELETIPWNAIMVMAPKGKKVRASDLAVDIIVPKDTRLNETQTLPANAAFGPGMIGSNNGEYVLSGLATQEVDWFVILVAPPSYTAPFAVVKQWIEVDLRNQFSVIMRMRYGGHTVYSTVSTEGYGVLVPDLTIQRSESGVSLGFPGGYEQRSYIIMNITSGEVVGNVTATQRLQVPTSEPIEFFIGGPQ